MIASVKITDLAAALEHNHFKEVTDWISLLDPEQATIGRRLTKDLTARGINHSLFLFKDISEDRIAKGMTVGMFENAPTKADVVEILYLLDTLHKASREVKLVINCWAGVSRSTAVGVLAWVMSDLAPMDALDKVINVRAEAWPNITILRLASEILNKDVHTEIDQWKKDIVAFHDNPETRKLFIP